MPTSENPSCLKAFDSPRVEKRDLQSDESPAFVDGGIGLTQCLEQLLA